MAVDPVNSTRSLPMPGRSDAHLGIAVEAVPFKEIADVTGRQLGLPALLRLQERFGSFTNSAAANMAAPGARTRSLLGWHPGGPGLIADLDQPAYFLG